MKIMRSDLVLLHAPGIYDFRNRPVLYEPVCNVGPSSRAFEMCHIGFANIPVYLKKHGYSVSAVNIALKMLNERGFDVVRLIQSFSTMAFMIDLHWIVNVQGCIEIASIVKKCHPDIPVIFSGMSASCFHQELMNYSEVDYVLRGDSVEEPARRLLAVIKKAGRPVDVPNLTWKDKGKVRVNELAYVPSNLDRFPLDYRQVMKLCAKRFDFAGHLPFRLRAKVPMTAVLLSRGCSHNCAVCGGSSFAYENICKRHEPAYRSPVLLAEDIGVISRHTRSPVMVLGDIRQAGSGYAHELLGALKKKEIRNNITFEFLSPPTKEFIRILAEAVQDFSIEISPESHDEDLRKMSGRSYGNYDLERGVFAALNMGCSRVDVFFMIGIPGQTVKSVMETVDYCETLLSEARKARHNGRLHPFIFPLAPFLDPGSRAFNDADRYGYKLFFRTLEEHKRALLEPSWKRMLNYETKWMNKDDIVAVTYDAALMLNKIKMSYLLTCRKEGLHIADRIVREKDLIAEIDNICAISDETERGKEIAELMSTFAMKYPSIIHGAGRSSILSRLNPAGILKVFSRFNE